MSSRVLQADGTYCYSGPDCKLHGYENQETLLRAKIAELFQPTEEKEEQFLLNHKQERFENTRETLKQFNITAPFSYPVENEQAFNRGMYEIECDANTSILLDVDTRDTHLYENRLEFTAWLVQDKETIAMLDVVLNRHKDGEDNANTTEAVVQNIEVKETHRGKGYSSKIISIVETNFLKQPLHTGGHYTPEGYKALKGRLPLSRDAVAEEEYVKKHPNRSTSMGVGVHFESMNFVQNWDKFYV